jgi:hypothetical protein
MLNLGGMLLIGIMWGIDSQNFPDKLTDNFFLISKPSVDIYTT